MNAQPGALETQLGSYRLTSPLMAASGCAGFGHELVRWGGLDAFGALVTPSLTGQPLEASEEMSLHEAPSSIVYPHTTPNVGAEALNASKLPWAVCGDVPVVVSVTGHSSGEFADAVTAIRRRSGMHGVIGVEVDLSASNEGNSNRPFARDEYSATKVISRVRECLPRNVLLMVKLRLDTEVVDIARSVIKAGADVLVMGHPPTAMTIDPVTLRPTTDGAACVAGPALLPITLAAVYELHAAMLAGRLQHTPIIASGGVATAQNAAAALAAGATAVQVGSALFRNPRAGQTMIDGLGNLCRTRAITTAELTGAAHR